MQNILIRSLPITLAQFLKWSGAALTGGQAKELIREGLVSLNGEVCLIAGQKLQPGDMIGVTDDVGEQQFKLVFEN